MQEAGCLDRLHIFAEKRSLLQRVRVAEVLPLPATDPVSSAWKGNGESRAGGIGAAGAMVEVEVRQDDVGNLLRRHAPIPKDIPEAVHVEETVVGEALQVLIPGAGVDKDYPVAYLYK